MTLSKSTLSDRPPASTSVTGRVLIVDDEPAVITALCDALTAQGYAAQGFPSGEEALAVLREQDYDVLLCDLTMPGMSGITLLRAALEIDPNLVGIIMTGQGSVQTAVEAMQVGALDYVLKPLRLSALLPILTRAMQVRQLRVENVQLREAVAIYELSTAIAFSLELDVLLGKAADAALQSCKADEVSIMLPTLTGAELYVAAVRGAGRDWLLGQRVAMTQGVAGWVASHREPLLLQGEVSESRFAPVHPRPDIHSAISVPLLVAGQLVGVLNANAVTRPRSFTVGDMKLLNVLASILAPALENVRFYAERRQAEAELHRAKEAAEAGNRVKTEFLAIMSHELRTPLNIIMGYTDLLLDGASGPVTVEQEETLRRIDRSSRRLFELISAMLDMGRLEVGQLPVEIREVHLPGLLDELEVEARESCNQAGLALSWRIEDTLSLVRTDPDKLKTVLRNLIGNAVKFTERGSVAVEAQSRQTGVQICVTDTGSGIPAESLAVIFDLFHQLDSSSTRRHEGVGLGLYIVKRLLDLLNGTVTVESQEGQGSTFRVWIPVGEQG